MNVDEKQGSNITSLSNLLLGISAPSKIVKLFQIRKSWPQNQTVPGMKKLCFALKIYFIEMIFLDSTAPMLQIMHEVEAWRNYKRANCNYKKGETEQRVAVISCDGISRIGTLISINLLFFGMPLLCQSISVLNQSCKQFTNSYCLSNLLYEYEAIWIQITKVANVGWAILTFISNQDIFYPTLQRLLSFICDFSLYFLGMYCTAVHSMEKAVDLGHFDVFQSAKSVRRSRPQLIENVGEYKFCYELVKEFVKENCNGEMKN
jgi:hypothetical protein